MLFTHDPGLLAFDDHWVNVEAVSSFPWFFLFPLCVSHLSKSMVIMNPPAAPAPRPPYLRSSLDMTGSDSSLAVVTTTLVKTPRMVAGPFLRPIVS